ncbi:hypothetical protein A0H81_11619 [Grifola frondosa]|uniref:BHLH domain-containing protein n=1 Tax=Grifola frondosa TaxID=5627 RepID=A0A1C7LUV8_GRIFR|nr:hypothetical protein A0H81_11619 [Grifola frondosa]
MDRRGETTMNKCKKDNVENVEDIEDGEEEGRCVCTEALFVLGTMGLWASNAWEEMEKENGRRDWDGQVGSRRFSFSFPFSSAHVLPQRPNTTHDMEHHPHMHDDSQNFVPQPYMYPTEEDQSYGGLVYPQIQQPYQVVQTGPPPRHMSDSDLQHAMQYQRSMNMMPAHNFPVYNSSPPHGVMPLSASPPPQSPMYDPSLLPSRDQTPPRTASTIIHATAAPQALPRPPALTASFTGTRLGRRSRGRSLSDDDDHMGLGSAETFANTRKEATRRQRIEAEQRRRDELRDGYARLKDVLPVSNQKSSKVSLLERATNYISTLEKTNSVLQSRLASLEQEVQRLRSLNEKISLGVGNTPSPGQINMDTRPLSPPPEHTLSVHHQLTSVVGQEPPIEESSPSASEGGY